MTDSVKATRATVTIGSLIVDGFMLPDGSYRMSLTQSAECIGLGVQNASDFLKSKALKALIGNSYTPQTFEAERRRGRNMSKITMDHPEGSRRSKDSREVQQMIWQYESQIATCKDEQAVSLMKQKLNGLKRLVEGEGNQK